MSRNILMPLVLGAALGIPYLASQEREPSNLYSPSQFPTDSITNLAGNQIQASQTAFKLDGQSNVILPGTVNGPDLNAMPLAFVPISNFGEVFRFDATPDGIKSRWDRISVFSSGSGLTGMRCDLTTGVNRSDLHGCLTYFFDKNQQVAKISFRGWTGDAVPLTKFAVDTWKVKEQTTGVNSAFSARSWGKPTAILILQTVSVIRSDQPNQNVAVFLEALSPNSREKLSPEMVQSLEALKQP